MNETKYVAISTQKGGAGKTTLTVLVASYLHYVKGYNVAVVDCDFPQYSVHDMRKRDLKAIMEDLRTHDHPCRVRMVCHTEDAASIYRQTYNLWYAETKEDRL